MTEQLLKMRSTPPGMELFTASGTPPGDVIKAAIDDTDSVVLVLGGRYGSTSDDGLSYTERELRPRPQPQARRLSSRVRGRMLVKQHRSGLEV